CALRCEQCGRRYDRPDSARRYRNAAPECRRPCLFLRRPTERLLPRDFSCQPETSYGSRFGGSKGVPEIRTASAETDQQAHTASGNRCACSVENANNRALSNVVESAIDHS